MEPAPALQPLCVSPAAGPEPSTAPGPAPAAALALDAVPETPPAPARSRPRGKARAQILALVLGSQGIGKTELAERSGYAWGTVCYHLEALESQGSVRVLRTAKSTMAFPPELHDKRMHWLAALRKPEVVAILGLFQRQRQLTITAVARATGLSARVARSRLDELVAAGIAQDLGARRPRFVLDGPTWSVLRALVAPEPAPATTPAS